MHSRGIYPDVKTEEVSDVCPALCLNLAFGFNGVISSFRQHSPAFWFSMKTAQPEMVIFSVRRLFWNIQKKRQVPTAKRA